MSLTGPRRQLLERAIRRLRDLAATERGRAAATVGYGSTALRNAEALDKQAAALQRELDADGK